MGIQTTVLSMLLVVLVVGCDTQAIDGGGVSHNPPTELEYFPLQTENEWHYREYYGRTHYPDEQWCLDGYVRVAVGEEVIRSGQRYFQITESSFDTLLVETETQTAVAGYDTSAARVMQLDASGTEQWTSYSPCDLDAAPGTKASCGWPQRSLFDVSETENWTGTVGADTVHSTFREYEGDEIWYWYAHGVGLLGEKHFASGPYRTELIYARVDGREMGTPIAQDTSRYDGPISGSACSYAG